MKNDELFKAVQSGKIDQVRKLLGTDRNPLVRWFGRIFDVYADPNALDEYERTAYFHARGKNEMKEALVALGFDPNARDKQGRTLEEAEAQVNAGKEVAAEVAAKEKRKKEEKEPPQYYSDDPEIPATAPTVKLIPLPPSWKKDDDYLPVYCQTSPARPHTVQVLAKETRPPSKEIVKKSPDRRPSTSVEKAALVREKLRGLGR